MYEMKEGGRSGEQSGAVVKKKSSSGCLIIKKKGGENGTVMGGFSGGPSSRHFFDSGKEKKRSRMVLSDSGSSDEFLEPVRRKVVPGSDKFRNGSAVYEKGFVGNREIERDMSRGGLDVFEFDEYERFDEKIRKDFYDDRLKLYRHSGDPRESGTGSSRIMVDKRTHSYLDITSNVLTAKSKSKYGSKKRFETEDDEAHLPISLLREKYREASDEPIRLQGKNGVLKVMVNKKKKMGLPHRSYDHVDAEDRKEYRSEDVFKKKLGLPQKNDLLEAEDRKGSRSEDATKKKAVMRPSFHSEKRPEKTIASMRMDKSELKLRKSLSTKSSKETEDSDIALKLGSPTMQACTSAKAVKNEGNRTPPTENITSGKGKDSKVKRGSGTEKQLLREKIRNMLLAAGWTIDYRPRRNRDYLDAVYINPSGTAYWSIIKAYEALQKQSEEEETAAKPVGEFTPLPDEILSKLTRQTRKKMEREMKKKRRDEGSSRNAKKARVKESAEGTDSDQQEEKLSSYMKQNRKSLKARLNEADHESGDDSSDNDKATPKQDRVTKSSSGTMIQGRKSRKIGRTLVVRSSDKGINSENDGFVPYTGKRTLLSWLIECGTVHMSEKVQYMNRRKTRAMLEGWVTMDGIHCGCCSKILTVSKFELHAGSKLRLPFPNIFLQSGQSLMQCQIDAWNKQEESDRKGFHTVNIDGDDPNDDTCGLCGDGGDLICCDGCPSTFHQSCLNIKMLPKGDWHCPNCACKFCRIAGGSSPEASGRAESSLLTCHLCEKKYHKLCSEEVDDIPADSGDATSSFCGHKCRELYSQLLKLLGVKHELESGFSWSLVCRSDPSSDTLPLEFSQKVECNSKLAVALSVMDECFLPIVDRRSGINLIHNVVYNCGSNFSRLNYSGFYTAILERGDEIISAASIRIHGTQLAEMPFIGTRHIYRRQGMCRRLLSAIESALSSFKVEKLIIPAIAEHMHTWTDVFGFNPIEESHKQEMRSMNMLVFPGTDMLQKPIVRHEIPKGNIAAPSGEKCVEVECNNLLAKKSELDSPNVNEIAGINAVTESSSQATPVVPSDDSSSDTACEPGSQSSSKEPVPINSPTVKKVEDPCNDLKCLSPSDTSPAFPEIEKPVLGSPVRDDVQVPVLANRSKLDSSLELDLNTCDNTEEQGGNDISDKVNDVDFGSLNAPCIPKPKSSHKESVSVDTESDKTVAESATDLERDSAGDASAVALEPPIKEENIWPDSNVAESASDLQCTLTSPVAVEPPVKKENIQSDNIAESAPGLQCTVTIPVALEPPVKNIQSDSMVAESSPDLQCTLTSPVALEPPVKKENIQSDSKVAESAHGLQCISVSVASPVVLETPKPLDKENIESPTADCTDDADEANSKASCLKLENESLGEQNPAEEENGNQNPESLSSAHGNDESMVKFSSDLNLPGPDETESKTKEASEVASNAETEHDLNLPGPDETESKTEEASEVASNAETEHKENTCTPALLL